MSKLDQRGDDLNDAGCLEMESTLSMSTKTANTNVNQLSTADFDTKSSIISQGQGSLDENNSDFTSFDKGFEESKLFSESKKAKLMSEADLKL